MHNPDIKTVLSLRALNVPLLFLKSVSVRLSFGAYDEISISVDPALSASSERAI